MEAIMDETEMEKSIKKLLMYKSNTDLSRENIAAFLKNLTENYKTNNTRIFNKLAEELGSKFIKVDKLMNEDIYVLDKNLNNYRVATKEVVDIFKNITK